MIPIYVINLDRCQDRLADMQSQLSKLGLSFQRVKAVEGLDLPPDLAGYFVHHNRKAEPIIEPGAVGCYASHLRVYQAIIASGAEHALVLEDDCLLPPDVLDILGSVIAVTPAGWDFIQLAKPPRHAVQRLSSLPVGHLVRYSRVPSGAVGYLISREGAHKLLDPSIERVWAIDTDTRRPWLFGLDVYGVVPNPLKSRDGHPSTIRTQGRRWRRGWPRPTPYTWTNMPLHSPRGVIWNMRKLGPLAWAKCALLNAGLRVGRAAVASARG
jgi:glycosyl transferase family 25